VQGWQNLVLSVMVVVVLAGTVAGALLLIHADDILRDLTQKVGPARISAYQLQAALRAVIDNGLNAATAGGRVEVQLHDGDGVVELVVVDDGPGISEAARPHLFDPFYSGREAGRGLGVGLAKAWRFVTNHGGAIAFDANAPRGARFTIRVPAKPQPSA